jgi:hypothetical protein
MFSNFPLYVSNFPLYVFKFSALCFFLNLKKTTLCFKKNHLMFLNFYLLSYCTQTTYLPHSLTFFFFFFLNMSWVAFSQIEELTKYRGLEMAPELTFKQCMQRASAPYRSSSSHENGKKSDKKSGTKGGKKSGKKKSGTKGGKKSGKKKKSSKMSGTKGDKMSGKKRDRTDYEAEAQACIEISVNFRDTYRSLHGPVHHEVTLKYVKPNKQVRVSNATEAIKSALYDLREAYDMYGSFNAVTPAFDIPTGDINDIPPLYLDVSTPEKMKEPPTPAHEFCQNFIDSLKENSNYKNFKNAMPSRKRPTQQPSLDFTDL